MHCFNLWGKDLDEFLEIYEKTFEEPLNFPKNLDILKHLAHIGLLRADDTIGDKVVYEINPEFLNEHLKSLKMMKVDKSKVQHFMNFGKKEIFL